MVLLDTDEMKKQYGRSNAKFELVPDPKKKPKNNKKVGGQLILSFSVMTDEAARKATEDERKALAAKNENDDQEEINVEEEMAKDATGMVEDHYDGPDITEVEEETPPPPKLSLEEEQQKMEEEKRRKIRDSYLQQQHEKLESNETDETVNLSTKIDGDDLNVVPGTKKVDDSVRDDKKVQMLTTAETEQSIETKSTDKGLLQKNDVDVHAPVQEKTEDLAASVNRGVEVVKSTSTTSTRFFIFGFYKQTN